MRLILKWAARVRPLRKTHARAVKKLRGSYENRMHRPLSPRDATTKLQYTEKWKIENGRYENRTHGPFRNCAVRCTKIAGCALWVRGEIEKLKNRKLRNCGLRPLRKSTNYSHNGTQTYYYYYYSKLRSYHSNSTARPYALAPPNLSFATHTHAYL